MKRIKEDTLLFLTACVHPKGMALTTIQDSDLRLQQYLEAIRFYLSHYSYKILVVENTGADLSPHFKEEIRKGRLECLTFNGNDFDRNLGKGYGEGVIINYAFQNSSFLQKFNYIIKVSGRHQVININAIMILSEWFLSSNPNLVVCEFNHKMKFVRSDCFIAARSFYLQYFNSQLARCNDSIGVWFEHVLFDSVIQACVSGFQILYLPIALEQRGVSGTTGNNLGKTRLRRKLHFFGRMLKYKFLWQEFNKYKKPH